MAYNFSTKNTHWLWLYWENLSPSDCHRFPKQKQDLRGLKFEEFRQAETVVKRWLIHPVNSKGEKSSAHDRISALNLGENYTETEWDGSKIKFEVFLVQRNVNNPEYMRCLLTLRPTSLQ
jgi:hypothetical protein